MSYPNLYGLSLVLIGRGYTVRCVQIEFVETRLRSVAGKSSKPTGRGYWSLKAWVGSEAKEWRSTTQAKCYDMAIDELKGASHNAG